MDRKTANTYLLLFGLLLIFLCSLAYRTSIEPSIKLKADVATLSYLGDTLNTLTRQLRKAKRVDRSGAATDSTVKGFAGLVSLCHRQGVAIVKSKPIEVRGKSELKNILIVDLEGGYVPLIKVLNQMESSLILGRIVSASYSSSFDLLQKKHHLVLRIILAIPEEKGTPS